MTAPDPAAATLRSALKRPLTRWLLGEPLTPVEALAVEEFFVRWHKKHGAWADTARREKRRSHE